MQVATILGTAFATWAVLSSLARAHLPADSCHITTLTEAACTPNSMATLPRLTTTTAVSNGSCLKKVHRSSDVVVIGAGISGLVAARELTKRDFSVVVLEARDRVGGRLLGHLPPNSGRQLDLGATWFWPGENRVEALIKELKVPIHPQHIHGDAMYHTKTSLQRLSGNPIDVPSGRFTNSAASLTDALAALLPNESLLLNSPVRTIRTSNDGAVVEYEGGVIDTKQVVLALPPALVAHAIAIEPKLPQQVVGLAAMTPVWMGRIAKAVIVYDTPFWRKSGLAGSANSQIGPLREIHDMSGPDGAPAALFGFAQVDVDTPPPSEAQVKQQMVDIFGIEAAAPCEVVVQDWSAEEFTSPPGVAGLDDYRAFGHPRFQKPSGHGRLHWASTETATAAAGHIEGAIAAAQRAVKAIASALSS